MKRLPFERRVSVSEASGRSRRPRSAPAYPGAGFNITRDRRLASGETVPGEPSFRPQRRNCLNAASIGDKRRSADGAGREPRKRLHQASVGRNRPAAPPMRPASQARASVAALPLMLLGIIEGEPEFAIRSLDRLVACAAVRNVNLPLPRGGGPTHGGAAPALTRRTETGPRHSVLIMLQFAILIRPPAAAFKHVLDTACVAILLGMIRGERLRLRTWQLT